MRGEKKQSVEDLYGDIIELPHFEPKRHMRMSLYKRAAQFAPFAALTGYGDAVKEVARYTEKGIELSEDEADQMDRKLMLLLSRNSEKPDISFYYFKPDEKKTGGSFCSLTGKIKKIDFINRELCLEDGQRILLENILDMEERK